MITAAELQRLAAQTGVRLEMQERDYALGWFLLGLSETPGLCQALAFKGGTALRKTYFPTYRFSEDLDFTLVRPVEKDKLQGGVQAVCHQVQSTSGMQMWIALWKQTRDVAGEEAYRARLAYVGPLGQRGPDPPRITLDLTHYELLVLPAALRRIIHPYSDAPRAPLQVPTYCLEEMLAEKLRALLRRCYPRDIYDVWYLLKHHDEGLDHSLLLHVLEEKCRHKGYSFSSAEDFLLPARRVGMSEAWNTSLQHLVSFPPTYEAVMTELETLLPHWLERQA
ncbi:MAG: nucleotidyl transferase AbiEii/AbiGii toxin family protein [Chloroflexi bacterium]|nr:nucleotidyl transferase AbiEii/AbiGii toxin family protein [Chloroflexota bacterium]